MSYIRLRLSHVILAGLVWFSILAHPNSGLSQTSTKPDTAAPSSSQPAGIPANQVKKTVKSKAWRSFGEKKNDKRTVAANQSGVWHHFGEDGPAPNMSPRKSAPTESSSGGRIVQSVPPPNTSTNRLAGVERELWLMVNHDRLDPANSAETKGGRARPLEWNEKLAEVARAHSRDMMEQGFFDHVDPAGRTPQSRIDAAGIHWRAMGENIATNGRGARDAEDAFMNEPSFEHNHRANILNPEFTEVGIGIVQDRRGRYYITQDFVGTPPAVKTQ
jgi:uncharacterized protein YkwD